MGTFPILFHHTAIAQQGTRKRGQATFSVVLSMSRDFLFLREKVACPHFLRVCLSEASYGAAEKSDEGMALKI